MGLQGSTYTFRRFAVRGQAPIWKDPAWLDEIRSRAFTGAGLQSEDGQARGWITTRHLYDTQFSLEGLRRGPYLSLALRLDKRRIPAAVKKAHIEIEEEAYRKANDVAKVPYAARRQIREEVMAKLIREFPATSQAYPWFWNLQAGRLYLSTLSGAVQEEFADLFEQTFGCTLAVLDLRAIGLELAGERGRAALEDPRPLVLRELENA